MVEIREAEQQGSEEEIPHNNIFIARQPIFRRNQKVYGYELLFRSSLANFFDPTIEGTVASSKVITNSFLLIGIREITEGKKAFINFTGDMLCREYPALFPKEITVVEVLEDVIVTREVVEACKFLQSQGYVLALDDFVYKLEVEPLLSLVDIIKIDVRAIGLEETERQVKILSTYNVKLLAEKIETIDEFEATREMGFHYFQGYFFKKPKIVAGKDIPGSKLQYLQILRLLQDENYDFHKLAKLVSQDVSISYKLLKYVNSAYFGRRQEIQSLQSAVAMIGEVDLRKWLALVMVAYLAEDKPVELIRTSMLRAEFCSLIAKHLTGTTKDIQRYYTAGMFSLLDAILDKSMAEILPDLNLAQEISDALLGNNPGQLMGALYLIRAYESGSWKTAFQLAQKLGLDIDNLPPMYSEALAAIKSLDYLE